MERRVPLGRGQSVVVVVSTQSEVVLRWPNHSELRLSRRTAWRLAEAIDEVATSTEPS